MNCFTLQTNDRDFKKDVFESELPVLVDFYADWCGPCRALAPSLEALAEQYQGRLKVVKIDVQDNPVVASVMGVRGIPALVLFKDGNVLEMVSGALPLPRLQAMVEPAL